MCNGRKYSLDMAFAAAEMLIQAENPAIYAGQGVHWAEAYDELRALAEHLAIPVMTSLPGKSAFDVAKRVAIWLLCGVTMLSGYGLHAVGLELDAPVHAAGIADQQVVEPVAATVDRRSAGQCQPLEPAPLRTPHACKR